MNMLLDREEQEAKHATESESLYLEDLHQNVAPRIQKELAMQQRVFSESPNTKSNLILLQTIRSRLVRIASNQIQQPLARDIGGSVDRDSTREDQPTIIKKISEESHGSSPRQKGSFTIVNPKVEQNWDSLPLGNKLFPELVVAVFDLETNLAKAENATCRITDVHEIISPASMKDRQPSSHCVVNGNVQFTPHVDSGRGAGQKLSMIVGMGDHVGGELKLEGDAFDIQFKPLVFAGWKLRCDRKDDVRKRNQIHFCDICDAPQQSGRSIH